MTLGRDMRVRALTVIPLQAGSAAVTEMPDPEPGPGELLVDGIALGVCGTDREIADGEYGWAPPGSERLCSATSRSAACCEAPAGSGFAPRRPRGRRRPPPRPGAVPGVRARRVRLLPQRPLHRARDQGAARLRLRALDGRGRLRGQARSGARAVGMLMEPTTILAKAWDQIEKIGSRAYFEPQRVLVTGAGPIGLLAALLGAQRGLEVHVLDRITDGPKPELVARPRRHLPHTATSATVARRRRRTSSSRPPGPSRSSLDAMTPQRRVRHRLPHRRVAARRPLTIDLGGLNRDIVLENDVVFGTVNANRRHYQLAAEALAARRPLVAGAPDHPPACRSRRFERGVRAAARRRQGRPRPLTGSPPWRRGRLR